MDASPDGNGNGEKSEVYITNENIISAHWLTKNRDNLHSAFLL